jgi:hypothetical protein
MLCQMIKFVLSLLLVRPFSLDPTQSHQLSLGFWPVASSVYSQEELTTNLVRAKMPCELNKTLFEITTDVNDSRSAIHPTSSQLSLPHPSVSSD